MLAVLGLILNTLGAFTILVPDIPKLYRVAHRLPPLKTIEEGEKQLYHEGELRPEHTGFGWIEEAFYSQSPPLSDAPRLDKAETTSAMVRIGDLELNPDSTGFQVKRILRNEGATISDSTYTVELYSQPALDIQNHLAQFGIESPNPYLTMDSSQGAFPRYIEQYKRKLIFRFGAFLLLAGFLFQLVDYVPQILPL